MSGGDPGPGRRLGSYELLRTLGAGGAGTVYLARARDGQQVAVKLLRQLQPDAFARFAREAELLRALGEPHGFVPLLEVGSEGGIPFLVMPFLPGGTLATRLAQGPLGLEEARRLGGSLGRALAAAHAQRIVHRDLKPENVLLDAGGRALIADLGLGKHLPGTAGHSLSHTGVFRGTVGYAPPEQLLDAKAVGPTADVFALGAVLYECLTGLRAFDGASPLEVVSAVEAGKVAGPRSLRPDCPPAVDALLQRCLARSPQRRPVDGAAFVQAWEEAWAPVRTARSSQRWAAGLLVGGVGLAGSIVALAPPAPGTPPSASASPGPAQPAATSSTPAEVPAPTPAQVAEILAPTPAEAWPLADGVRGVRLRARLGPARGKQTAMLVDLDVSPDGTLVATSGFDGIAAIWDLQQGLSPRQRIPTGAAGGSVFLRFDPTGRWLHAGTRTGLITYDVASGRESRRRETERIESMVRLHDGSLVTSAAGGLVRRYAADSLEELQSFAGHDRGATVATDASGTRLFTADRAGVLREWRVDAGGGPVRESAAFAGKEVFSLAPSPDASRLVVTDAQGMVYLWDVDRGVALRSFDGLDRSRVRGPGHTRRALWRADGSAFLTCGDDDLLHEWDAASGQERRRLAGHWSWPERMAQVPEQDLLLSLGNDMILRGWRLSTGEELWTGRGHSGRIQTLAWAPDGTLWSAGQDQTARRWDPVAARELEVRRGPYPADRLLIGADGRVALGVSSEQQALVWEAVAAPDPAAGERSLLVAPLVGAGNTALGSVFATRTGEWVRLGAQGFERRQVVSGPVHAAAFTPGGDQAALITGPRAWTRVDVVTGELSVLALPASFPEAAPAQLEYRQGVLGAIYPGGQAWLAAEGRGGRLLGEALRLALSPDGRLVAVAGFGGLEVQRVQDGVVVASLPLTEAEIAATALAFTAGGESLAVGTALGEILVLELALD